MNAEGWYQDPYGRHEARWISDGEPTKLVRDGVRESYDSPPEDVTPGPLVELAAWSWRTAATWSVPMSAWRNAITDGRCGTCGSRPPV